jgi:UDP-N-acetyl-D-mannosaminuronate dehydrogenase
MNNICVLGLGYVGFPLLMRLVNSGYSVIGYDSSKDKMLNLQNRVLHYEHLDKKLVEATLNQESVLFTSNILDVNSEVFIICVPTPLDTFDLPDLSYVIEAVNLISKVAKSGNQQVIRALSETLLEKHFIKTALT